MPKTPEELAEIKFYLDFTKSFRENITQAENDICEFRALSHPAYGIKTKPLWPRKISKEDEQKERLQKEEEDKARKAKEEAEAEQRRIEEEATKAAAKGGAKGKPPA